MTPDIALKVLPAFLTNLGVAITLFIAVTKDAFATPLKWVGVFVSLSTIITSAFFLLSSLHIGFVIGVFVLNGLTFGAIYNVVKDRDIGGINYGQLTIEYFNRLDQQISYILDGISVGKDKTELRHAVSVALSFSIRAITHLLALDVKHDAHFSIFYAKNGHFQVVASDGIPEEHIQLIQKNFRYGQEPIGLAGHAVSICKILSMKDVSDTSDPNFNKWAPTIKDEPRTGAIICIPLNRGLKSEGGCTPIGVINLTSMKKGAFESVPKRVLLNRFSVKVEMLLYCMEMLVDKNIQN